MTLKRRIVSRLSPRRFCSLSEQLGDKRPFRARERLAQHLRADSAAELAERLVPSRIRVFGKCFVRRIRARSGSLAPSGLAANLQVRPCETGRREAYTLTVHFSCLAREVLWRSATLPAL